MESGSARELRERRSQIRFTLQGGTVGDPRAIRVNRGQPRQVRIAVGNWPSDGIILPEEAVDAVDPQALSELLTRQVAPGAAGT